MLDRGMVGDLEQGYKMPKGKIKAGVSCQLVWRYFNVLVTWCILAEYPYLTLT